MQSGMQEGLARLSAAAQRGLSVAWCVVLSTEGGRSVKPGGVLVTDGISILWGTAGPQEEGELVHAAGQALQDGHPLFVELSTENRFDSRQSEADGRITVLVDPVMNTFDAEYYDVFSRALRSGRGVTEAIALPGADLAGERGLFDRNGNLLASRGAERPLEHREKGKGEGEGNRAAGLARSLRPLDQHSRPYRERDVAYLPFSPRVRLLIAGAGPVAEEVCRLAAHVGFDVWVVDETPELVAASRFPDAKERLAGALADAIGALPLDRETFAIVVRQKYQPDLEALKRLANRGLGYLGMIGNQRKVGSILADLRSAGFPEEILGAIRAPLGLPIGSRSVPEIAISVVAELIATRNLEHSA